MTGTGATRTAPTFTPESAGRALPYVKAVVKDMVESLLRVRRAEALKERALAGHASAGATPEEREAALRRADEENHAARAVLARTEVELEAVGVEVRDREIGLVDFPCESLGRRVFLCWKHGEERVAWWHEPGAGLAGRRPLPLPGAAPGAGST